MLYMIYIHHYILKPALKSIKLKHSPTEMQTWSIEHFRKPLIFIEIMIYVVYSKSTRLFCINIQHNKFCKFYSISVKVFPLAVHTLFPALLPLFKTSLKLLIKKKQVGITFTLLRTSRAFFGHGDSGCSHCED